MIEDSIFVAVEKSLGPLAFDDIVGRVQAQHPEYGRGALAAALAGLINKQRIFLDDKRTGFVAVRVRRDGKRFLERAFKRSNKCGVQFA